MVAAATVVLAVLLLPGQPAAATSGWASFHRCRGPPAFVSPALVDRTTTRRRRRLPRLQLSMEYQPLDQLADDDLVALPFDGYVASTSSDEGGDDEASLQLRLCVVRNQGESILPLIRHEDDVETDLFLDPRHVESRIQLVDVVEYWARQSTDGVPDGILYYGVGWYGQRPVPSLGGGPGYGAEADEVWSIDEEVLEGIVEGGEVAIPIIDVGMAHGEKARGGALF